MTSIHLPRICSISTSNDAWDGRDNTWQTRRADSKSTTRVAPNQRGLSLSELHTIPHHGKLSLTISRVWEKRTCFLWGMSIITRIYCHHRGVDEILPPGINFDHERQWVMQGCKIRSKTLNLATSCQMKPETSSKMWMRREGSTTWSWSRYTPWANMLHM